MPFYLGINAIVRKVRIEFTAHSWRVGTRICSLTRESSPLRTLINNPWLVNKSTGLAHNSTFSLLNDKVFGLAVATCVYIVTICRGVIFAHALLLLLLRFNILVFMLSKEFFYIRWRLRFCDTHFIFHFQISFPDSLFNRGFKLWELFHERYLRAEVRDILSWRAFQAGETAGSWEMFP